jgi:hypothetical protein
VIRTYGLPAVIGEVYLTMRQKVGYFPIEELKLDDVRALVGDEIADEVAWFFDDAKRNAYYQIKS